MQKKYSQRVKYTVKEGKLCIEHYLALQRLTFQKKNKQGEYKQYNSYHIKLPRTIYDLLKPKDNQLYLKQVGNKILILTKDDEAARRVKIQQTNKKEDNRPSYSLTIPKKLLFPQDIVPGEVYILCTILATDSKAGYTVTLEMINDVHGTKT